MNMQGNVDREFVTGTGIEHTVQRTVCEVIVEEPLESTAGLVLPNPRSCIRHPLERPSSAPLGRAFVKRMLGIEPTTFCMATNGRERT